MTHRSNLSCSAPRGTKLYKYRKPAIVIVTRGSNFIEPDGGFTHRKVIGCMPCLATGDLLSSVVTYGVGRGAPEGTLTRLVQFSDVVSRLAGSPSLRLVATFLGLG